MKPHMRQYCAQRLSKTLGLALLLVTVAVALAACGNSTSNPQDDDAILIGDNAQPKRVATIVLTPTASPVVQGGDTVNIVEPTRAIATLQMTHTKEPFVGIYLGDLIGSDDDEPLPTLEPVVPAAANQSGSVSGLPAGTGIVSGTSVDARFTTRYEAMRDQLGAPLGPAVDTQMAYQRFERGMMYWQGSQRQIYALADDGRLVRVADTFDEGMPESDPNLVPPQPNLVQPVRGFGKAWRENPTIRDGLGWGTSGEVPHTGLWQDFERGAMFVGTDGQVVVLFLQDGRYTR
ncbi:MAG: hypothetical protein GYB65_23760 [Chloroflexi bacterium]|nr:hypothetical protein [Chloroflexota bacterium]